MDPPMRIPTSKTRISEKKALARVFKVRPLLNLVEQVQSGALQL